MRKVRHIVKSIERIREGSFDIVHNHTEFGVGLMNLLSTQTVSTLHCTLERVAWGESIPTIYEEFSGSPFVAISYQQKKDADALGINTIATIHNAVKSEEFSFSKNQGKYLVFLGLLFPHKGVHHAIKVARKVGIPLKIAGKRSQSKHYKEFYEYDVDPYIDGEFIEYVGELNDLDKAALLKDALALLVPIEWQEPFGLVMIEAMACGTPVVAFRRGAAPEIVQDGVTGMIVDSFDEMCSAVSRIDNIDRSACRNLVRQKFDSSLMVSRYEKVYENLLSIDEK